MGIVPRFRIREHIPLEQGLRPDNVSQAIITYFYQRAYSIRTRIKTFRETDVSSSPLHIREHIPLEQGLRLYSPQSKATAAIDQRAYSIRTRIKTDR